MRVVKCGTVNTIAAFAARSRLVEDLTVTRDCKLLGILLESNTCDRISRVKKLAATSDSNASGSMIFILVLIPKTVFSSGKIFSESGRLFNEVESSAACK